MRRIPMRTPDRLCQLIGVAAVFLLGACTGTGTSAGVQTGSGGGAGTGGTGTGGASAATGGSGWGGSVAPGGSDAGDSDGAISPGDGGVSDGGGDGRAPVMASVGCNKMPTQALSSYVRHPVTGMNRVYDLWLPDAYQPSRAYPIIFVDHGCDRSIPFSTGNNSMQKVTQGNAIIVALRAVGGCFDTGPGSTSLREVPYFDQLLKDAESNYCVDQARACMGRSSSR